MPYSPFSPEVQAQAAAEVATGSSVKSVAERYHTTPTTVRKWCAKRAGANFSAIQDMHQTTKNEVRTTRMPELMQAYIEQGIATLTKQLEVTGTEAYIMKQSAGSLAILHGVTADKLLRVLSALRPAEERQT